MTDALRFDGVSKTFGARRALDALSFHIPRGSLAGFIGPNGAGKTTAFGVVGGFLEQDEGEIEVLGLDAFDPNALRGRLGVLPQDADLPPRHTAHEFLVHLALLQGMSWADAVVEAETRLSQVNLMERCRERIQALSHGMRRRVAVASALLGTPELVLLDEPMAGLDPVQAAGVRDVLQAMQGEATMVVSSHDLYELERICDWVVMVDRGTLVRQGSVSDVTEQRRQATWSLAAGDLKLDVLRNHLPNWEVTAAQVAEGQQMMLRAPTDADLDAASVIVMQHLIACGIGVRGLQQGSTLEASFVASTSRRFD